MTPSSATARFDDLVAGRAWEFGEVTGTLVAWTPDAVRRVLRAAEEATERGAWAFGFVTYEAASGLDPTLAVHEPVDGLPLVWFGLCGPPRDVPVVRPVTVPRDAPAGPWTCDWDADDHGRAVAAARERIAGGETYQVNLTTRMRSTVHGDLRAMYADLALGQRGAHNAFLDAGRFVIAGASPELFFEWRDDRLSMRPMKGTARRGRTTAEDAVLAARLRASAKERAENVMIVDLVRNDLGRIARTGSVTVSALLRPERFETVHQLTSEVSADLRPGTGLVDVFTALFPCGSVTGAPKARTMRIIRDLEPTPRGIYCGAIGFLAPPGNPVRARFHVAIRTALVDRRTGAAVYGTGGGITWGSEPAAEYDEMLAKARILHARSEEFHLIETMRHVAGRGIASLDAHLARMASSAAYFGFPFDPVAVRTDLESRLTGSADARVRLLAFRDGRRVIDVGGLPPPASGPLLLEIDGEPIDSRLCWPHHKTSRREPYLARRERHPEADEVLLVNERGELTEASTANLAARIDGQWWTPPVGGGCLPGVERGRLVLIGVLRERVLLADDLRRADGIALVNALRGWRPALMRERRPETMRRPPASVAIATRNS